MHLTHVEDLVLRGLGKQAAEILTALVERDDDALQTKIKIDGRPAIIVGKDTDGQFFISKKSGLRNPAQRYKSLKQIQNSGLAPELTNTLSFLYDQFKYSQLRFDVPHQGDLIYAFDNQFDANHVHQVQPNVIVYRLPEKTVGTRVGICFHTRLEFNGTLLHATTDPITVTGNDTSIYVCKNSYSLKTILSKMDADLADKLKEKISEAERWCNLPPSFQLKKASMEPLERFINNAVKMGLVDSDVRDFVTVYPDFVYNEAVKHAEMLKTEAGKVRVLEAGEALADYIRTCSASFTNIFRAWKTLAEVKNSILSIAVNPMDLQASIEDQDSFGEGLVVTSRHGTFKLVNRETFSYRNFVKHGEA